MTILTFFADLSSLAYYMRAVEWQRIEKEMHSVFHKCISVEWANDYLAFSVQLRA